MTEQEIQKCIVSYLAAKGWGSNIETKKLSEKGCDIVLRNDRYGRYFFIECKGDPKETTKNKHSSREVAFVYSLGQIITRIDNPKAGYYYGLGLPEKTAKIAMRRISRYLALHLKLHIFSVRENGVVKEYKPGKVGIKRN